MSLLHAKKLYDFTINVASLCFEMKLSISQIGGAGGVRCPWCPSLEWLWDLDGLPGSGLKLILFHKLFLLFDLLVFAVFFVQLFLLLCYFLFRYWYLYIFMIYCHGKTRFVHPKKPELMFGLPKLNLSAIPGNKTACFVKAYIITFSVPPQNGLACRLFPDGQQDPWAEAEPGCFDRSSR